MDARDTRIAVATRCVGRCLAVLVVVLALGVVPGNASVADVGLLGVSAGSRNQPGQDKVDLCHNGHTITVAQPAVQAHTGHGDARGACPAEPIAAYRVDVECAVDTARARTTCAFAGMADETGEGGPDAGGEDGKDVSV